MPGPIVLLIVPFWYPKSLFPFCGQGFSGLQRELPWWGELAEGQYPCPCLALALQHGHLKWVALFFINHFCFAGAQQLGWKLSFLGANCQS